MVMVNAQRLKSERISKGMSRCRLSLLSGLGSNAVFRIETKQQKVSLIRPQEVANTLDYNVNDLIDKKS